MWTPRGKDLNEWLFEIESDIADLKSKSEELEVFFEVVLKFLEQNDPALADKFVEYFLEASNLLDNSDRPELDPAIRAKVPEGSLPRARIASWIFRYSENR